MLLVSFISKPDEERIMIRREYNNVQVKLRTIFQIPNDEFIVNFEWDKSENVLRLITLNLRKGSFKELLEK